MRADLPRDACAQCVLLDQHPEHLARQRPRAAAQKHPWRIALALGQCRPELIEVLAQRLLRRAAERNDALLAPLAEALAKTLIEMQVFHAQCDDFGGTSASGVERLQ